MGIRTSLISAFVIAAYGASAQHAALPAMDTVIKGSTIEVIQSYKPEVKQAPKPEWMPQLPPADSTHPPLNLDVPQQTLYYTYSSEPLRPLQLGKDTPPAIFRNYVKAGGGNLSTLFLDAEIGEFYGDNYETAIHVHHLSQKGTITNEKSALTGIEADGTQHRDNSEWHAGISAERNQYSYYGYDHKLLELSSDSVKQVYTTVRIVADMKNKADSADRLLYHPAINASMYDAKPSTTETSIGIFAPVTYKLDSSLDLFCAFTGDITHFNSKNWNTFNNFAELQPGIVLHIGPVTSHALMGLALGSDGSGFILPDLLCSYKFTNNGFTLSGGWQASVRRNTYEELSTDNPYMINAFDIHPTRKDEIFVNLQGSRGKHFTFSARASWWNLNNLATYLNDTGDHKAFRVVYEDANVISLHLAARYTQSNIWSAGVTGDFFGYYNISQKYVWGEPAIKIKGDISLTPTPKLMFTVYLALLDGIHALNSNHAAVTLSAITDLGLNAEYLIIPRLSAFVQVNNLLNEQYQRWYGYQSYGINVYGGLRLKF